MPASSNRLLQTTPSSQFTSVSQGVSACRKAERLKADRERLICTRSKLDRILFALFPSPQNRLRKEERAWITGAEGEEASPGRSLGDIRAYRCYLIDEPQ